MFTGIVEAVGTVAGVSSTGGAHRIRIQTPLAGDLKPGESLAVNGVCLTVLLAEHDEVHADVGPETSRVTTLGGLTRGHRANLERPMRADGRFGGHLVLGHVDGVGTVEAIRPESGSYWLTVRFPASLAPYFIHKGSIAVDGISLTVARLGDTHFDVQVVPFTWDATTLSSVKAGDAVNLECDMIGKYVVRALERSGQRSGSMREW